MKSIIVNFLSALFVILVNLSVSQVYAATSTAAPVSGAFEYGFDQGPAYTGRGPVVRSIGPIEFTWTSRDWRGRTGSVGGVDYVDSVNLGSAKGFWNGRTGFSYVAGYDIMRIEFSSAVSSVGGFMNYSQFSDDFSISIFGTGNSLLETWDIIQDAPINQTGVNKGSYRGFDRATSDIYALELSVFGGGGAVIDNLTIAGPVSTVPLPATAWLLIVALGLVVAVRQAGSSRLRTRLV